MKITASVFSVGCFVNLFLPFGFAELRGTVTSSINHHESHHNKVVEGTLVNDDRYHNDRIDEIRSTTTASTTNIDSNNSNGNGRKLAPSGALTTIPDDYPSLSEALNAGQQNIYIKDGTYDVDSTIQISTPNIKIQGESRDGTILRYTGSASFLLVTDTTNVTVSSLTLDAKTFDVPETNEIWEAFGAVNVHQTTLKDCNVYGSNNMLAVFFAGPSQDNPQ